MPRARYRQTYRKDQRHLRFAGIKPVSKKWYRRPPTDQNTPCQGLAQPILRGFSMWISLWVALNNTSHNNRENQDQQTAGVRDENRIEKRVRYSFSLTTRFRKQPNTSYTECEEEGQHKREGRELGRERSRYWFFLKILWLETSPRKYTFLATFFNIQINSLADRFLMEIEENVNPRME